jgi:hypothetical protein
MRMLIIISMTRHPCSCQLWTSQLLYRQATGRYLPHDCHECSGRGAHYSCACGQRLELQVEIDDGMCASCWCELHDSTRAEVDARAAIAAQCVANDNGDRMVVS